MAARRRQVPRRLPQGAAVGWVVGWWGGVGWLACGVGGCVAGWAGVVVGRWGAMAWGRSARACAPASTWARMEEAAAARGCGRPRSACTHQHPLLSPLPPPPRALPDPAPQQLRHHAGAHAGPYRPKPSHGGAARGGRVRACCAACRVPRRPTPLVWACCPPTRRAARPRARPAPVRPRSSWAAWRWSRRWCRTRRTSSSWAACPATGLRSRCAAPAAAWPWGWPAMPRRLSLPRARAGVLAGDGGWRRPAGRPVPAPPPRPPPSAFTPHPTPHTHPPSSCPTYPTPHPHHIGQGDAAALWPAQGLQPGHGPRYRQQQGVAWGGRCGEAGRCVWPWGVVGATGVCDAVRLGLRSAHLGGRDGGREGGREGGRGASARPGQPPCVPHPARRCS